MPFAAPSASRPERTREPDITGGPFHAIVEDSAPCKAIAEVVGRRLNIPVVSKSADDAAEHFGWFTMFAGMDAPTSSAHPREARPEAGTARAHRRYRSPRLFRVVATGPEGNAGRHSLRPGGYLDEVDERPQRRGHEATSGIVQEWPGEALPPGFEYWFQSATVEVRA
jgi:hypothetical protein